MNSPGHRQDSVCVLSKCQFIKCFSNSHNLFFQVSVLVLGVDPFYMGQGIQEWTK